MKERATEEMGCMMFVDTEMLQFYWHACGRSIGPEVRGQGASGPGTSTLEATDKDSWEQGFQIDLINISQSAQRGAALGVTPMSVLCVAEL